MFRLDDGRSRRPVLACGGHRARSAIRCCCGWYTWACRTCCPRKPTTGIYAQHLDLGYLDHPPMVAWLIGLGAGRIRRRRVRRPHRRLPVLVRHGGFCFALARNLFGKGQALVTVMLAAVLPSSCSASSTTRRPLIRLLGRGAASGAPCWPAERGRGGRGRIWPGRSRSTRSLCWPATLAFIRWTAQSAMAAASEAYIERCSGPAVWPGHSLEPPARLGVVPFK